MQSEKYRSEGYYKDAFSFLVETMETAVKSWHETSKVDARVYFLLDKEKTDTEKYASVVNIDKVPIFLPCNFMWFHNLSHRLFACYVSYIKFFELLACY